MLKELALITITVSNLGQVESSWQQNFGYEVVDRGQVSEEDKQRLRNALLEYCSQDTFAMVRLLDFLTATSSGGV